MSECFSCLKDATRKKPLKLIEIKNVTLKLKKEKSEWVVFNINYEYPMLHEPKLEKLIVSVNGKEVEVKL
jgi:hypothetical protein